MIVDTSPKDIVKTELGASGAYEILQIRKVGNPNDMMKMDLDCYADYKMQQAHLKRRN